MKIYIDEILKATGGKLYGNKDTKDVYVTGAAIDSRNVKENYLFIPNITENFDGQDFIQKSFESGAIATLIQREIKDIDESKYYIEVDNIKEAFYNLAKYNRQKYNIPVIGITGSVGKTTAKEMIATVLEEKYNVHRTCGNFNSELGLPLMAMAIEEGHEIAVLEMGTDHEGEMSLLESIASPTDAVIMNIGVSHLEKFGTRDNIYKEKANVFKNIKQKENILLNYDNDILQNHKDEVNVTWYGVNGGDITGNVVKIEDGKVYIKVKYNGEETEYTIPGLSEHLIYPAMAAIYFGIKYNLSKEEIANGFMKYKSLKMRMDIQKLDNGILVIDDTYNANPQSMKAAIDVLAKLEHKNKIAILGDMFELGDDSDKMHKEVGTYLINKDITHVILIGNNAKYIYNELIENTTKKQVYYFENKDEKYEKMQKIISKENTAILLKASRGMKFEEIIQKIQEL